MEVVKYIFPITPRFNVGHKKGIKLKYVGLHSLTKSNFHPLQNIQSYSTKAYSQKKGIGIKTIFSLTHQSCGLWVGSIGVRLCKVPALGAIHQLVKTLFFCPSSSYLAFLLNIFASPLREISLHSEREFMLIKTAINQIVIILPNTSTCELGGIFSLIQSYYRNDVTKMLIYFNIQYITPETGSTTFK